jgi:hypothetical protein
MSSYFQRVPDFNYVSRLPDSKIGDYIRVKNLFKKGKLREDIFQNLAFLRSIKSLEMIVLIMLHLKSIMTPH